MFNKLFESELTKALKKSEQKKKVDNVDRKEGDEEKIDLDLKAKELAKNNEPNSPKKTAPTEIELMAMELGAAAEVDDAEAANIEQDTAAEAPAEGQPEDKGEEEEEEECEDGDEECEKKKKEAEEKEETNEAYKNIFRSALK